MIPQSEFNLEMDELYSLMSDISEECYCAGWMNGLEYAIWGAISDGDTSYGMSQMDSELLKRISSLAEKLQGWVVWQDDADDPEMPVEEWGPYLMPLNVWKKKYEKHSQWISDLKLREIKK